MAMARRIAPMDRVKVVPISSNYDEEAYSPQKNVMHDQASSDEEVGKTPEEATQKKNRVHVQHLHVVSKSPNKKYIVPAAVLSPTKHNVLEFLRHAAGTDKCRISCFLIIFILFGGLLLVILRFISFNIPNRRFPDPTINTKDPHAINVVLLGDSLINKPFTMFDLGYLLSRQLETFYHHINIYNFGVNGEHIDQIAARIPDVLSVKPHAVIIQWDSDFSNQPVTRLIELREELESQYVQTLESIVTELYDGGVEYVAISTPLLLGESTFLQKPYFRGREGIIKHYISLNEQVAGELNCTFIDMHQHFLRHLPSTWHLSYYYLTLDGEHPNRYGTHIIAQIFGEHLQEWLQKRENQ